MHKPAPTEGRAGGQDDLLFFVRSETSSCERTRGEADRGDAATASWTAQGFNTLRARLADFAGSPTKDRVFVRRWTPDVLTDVGPVNWRETLFLNVIAHTSFLLTIAVCTRQMLTAAASGKGGDDAPLRPISRIVKPVYATPSHATVSASSLDAIGRGGKGGRAKEDKAISHDPTYPMLYFTVDDYAEAFEDTVISDPDHCLCVNLSATDSVVFHVDGVGGEGRGGVATEDAVPVEDERVGTLIHSGEHSVTGAPEEERGGEVTAPQRKRRRVTLFSGFVQYDQLRDAFADARRGSRGALERLSGALRGISQEGSPIRRRHVERIIMAGPGGLGRAEVAAFEPLDTTASSSGDGCASTDAPQRGSGGGWIAAGKSVVTSSATALRGLVGGGGEKRTDGVDKETALRLQCCVMSVCMRWDQLAHDILFRPPLLLPAG